MFDGYSIVVPDLDANENTSGSIGATYRTQGGTVFAANAWGSTNRTDFDSTADGPAAISWAACCTSVTSFPA